MSTSKQSVKDISWLERLEMLLMRFSHLGIGS